MKTLISELPATLIVSVISKPSFRSTRIETFISLMVMSNEPKVIARSVLFLMFITKTG